jgi:hypothetical protein
MTEPTTLASHLASVTSVGSQKCQLHRPTGADVRGDVITYEEIFVELGHL